MLMREDFNPPMMTNVITIYEDMLRLFVRLRPDAPSEWSRIASVEFEYTLRVGYDDHKSLVSTTMRGRDGNIIKMCDLTEEGAVDALLRELADTQTQRQLVHAIGRGVR